MADGDDREDVSKAVEKIADALRSQWRPGDDPNAVASALVRAIIRYTESDAQEGDIIGCLQDKLKQQLRSL